MMPGTIKSIVAMRIVLIASTGDAAPNVGFFARDVDLAVVNIDPNCDLRTGFFIDFDLEFVVCCHVAVRFRAVHVGPQV